jgi:hypothetical protein
METAQKARWDVTNKGKIFGWKKEGTAVKYY